jgi:hypothetical protein
MNRGSIAIAVALIVSAIVVTAAVEAMAVRATMVGNTPWYVHLANADAALDAGRAAAASHHWRDAYVAAMASRRSQGLVEVGAFYRRLGARGGFEAAAVTRARECYLTGLLRARAEHSIDGVLQATEAFLELGDDAMVGRGLQIAREVATRDPDPRAQERVRILEARATR